MSTSNMFNGSLLVWRTWTNFIDSWGSMC